MLVCRLYTLCRFLVISIISAWFSVFALDSRSSGPDSSSGRRHSVVSLSRRLYTLCRFLVAWLFLPGFLYLRSTPDQAVWIRALAGHIRLLVCRIYTLRRFLVLDCFCLVFCIWEVLWPHG